MSLATFPSRSSLILSCRICFPDQQYRHDRYFGPERGDRYHELIGATNLFVRAPFLIEGILIGLVGAAIPLGLLYVVYNRVISYVMAEFSVLSNFMAFMPVSAVFRILLPVGLILGMGIGLVGSIFTIRKHLKV